MKIDLGAALKRTGMSQSELARRASTSKGYISQIVSGQKTPSVKALTCFAEALGLQPADLYAKDQSSATVDFRSGFSEPDVEVIQFDSSQDHMRALRTLSPSLRHPTIYRVRRSQPWLGMLRDDALVLDLSTRPIPGDIVLVTVIDTSDNVAETFIRRWLDPWLISGDPKEPPQRLDPESQRIAILGTVKGNLRGILST